MNEIQLVNLKKQYELLREEINTAISSTLENSKFILGPETCKFEKDFAAFCDAKYSVALSSGTDALKLALSTLGVKRGDEVITVPNTFIATVEAIIGVGAKPVFCEIEEQTFTLDVKKLNGLITEKTKAILPVDLYGHPCDLSPIMDLAEKHDFSVVEDACQAHGAKYGGKMIGGIAHATVFSFYPSKNLGSYGDGGAITTNDEELAGKISALRDHGRLTHEKYKHDYIGGNYRMDELQAAILNVKLKYLEKWIEARRNLASLYSKLIDSKHVRHPEEASYARHAYYLYVIRSKKRDMLKKFLLSEKICCEVHYPLPLHLQPALKFLGRKKGDFEITEQCSDTVLSLPLYPELEEKEIMYISDKINKFFK
ncbi:DegT/DnrJ/EryC1/StrS family aminotransferase [Candidatus Woesearchaeota archaeon]|nr:DegT/DnrJ/EryC1/StrS family aminotransferase [Candidatus Woesearchaeota archaeon]